MMTIISNGPTKDSLRFRQNRRRERPGSRSRRTISRRSNIRDECEEGTLFARDVNVPLPSDRSKPSPLLRQSFDQSWRRWKAKQAEEAAPPIVNTPQIEQERMLLFGGYYDDDELIRLGILDGEQKAQESETPEAVDSPDATISQQTPEFFVRPSKRSQRHRSKWPLFEHLISVSERDALTEMPIFAAAHDDAGSSLQSTPVMLAASTNVSANSESSGTIHKAPQSTSREDISRPDESLNSPQPSASLPTDDWTIITDFPDSQPSTPSSELETWILCDDS